MDSGGAESSGVESGGAESGGAESSGAERGGVESGGAESSGTSAGVGRGTGKRSVGKDTIPLIEKSKKTRQPIPYVRMPTQRCNWRNPVRDYCVTHNIE